MAGAVLQSVCVIVLSVSSRDNIGKSRAQTKTQKRIFEQ